MTISADGNIGIGTTNPENSESWNKVLEVKGNETSKFINSTSMITTGIWSHDYGFMVLQQAEWQEHLPIILIV